MDEPTGETLPAPASAPRQPSAWQWLPWVRASNVARAKAEACRKAADEFERDFAPKEGVDYSWVRPFALEAYEQTAKTADTLDTKAEKFIGFVGTVTGVAAAILAQSATAAKLWLILSVLPAVVLALVAITVALRAHRPMPQTEMPNISEALAYAEYFKNRGADAFCGKLHQAREHQSCVVAQKARMLKLAYDCAVTALWLLLLPVVVALASTARGA